VRVYLDASAIIYSIESALPFRQKVLDRMAQAENVTGGIIITSILPRLECRVRPMREGNALLLSNYDLFFTRRSLLVADIDGTVIERATVLRAQLGLKTPDAIHLATASELRADTVLTGDRDFLRFSAINVELL
jgi:uncharacterized protein